MSALILIPFLAALCAWALVAGALVYRPRSAPQWLFLLGIILFSLEALFAAASFDAVSLEEMLFWQRAATVVTACLPGTWLAFSLTYARGNPTRYLRAWLPGLIIIGLTPLVVALGLWETTITEAAYSGEAALWVFPVGLSGKVVHAALLMAAVLVLTNLEWTFRAAVGTARWKIKYAIIGLTLLGGARIYTSSQVILYSAANANLIVINALALALACVFFGVSVYRSKLSQVDIYPSATALHKSFAVLLAGAYLILVGLLARGVAALGGATSFPLLALFILAALAGLGVLCFSDHVRQTIRGFVNRHFKRPTHDYRQVWSDFTQKTAALLDKAEYARAVTRLLSETFEALSVTVWLAESRQGRLSFAASTTIEPGAPEAQPLPARLLQELAARPGEIAPLDLDRATESWCETLRQSNPTVFPKGGHRFCLPLSSGGEIVGLIVLGDRVNGVPLSPEDLELFKCLGDQIAAGIRNLNLSEKLLQARELEAFQTMSAFLIHDLKNTASALGLTLKNLPVHFDNPAFRQDALRTLARSAERVNELIGRLTTLRQTLEVQRARADLNDVITAALKTADDHPRVTIQRESAPIPPFLLDAAQLESVMVNLLFNAREAIVAGGQPGEIRVASGQENGEAWIAVTDNGCGMSPDFLRDSLFKPFKTTKKTGLGIGMFHTKAIVEAHGGRISVQSEPGQGTTFHIRLPLSESEPK